MRRKQHVLVIFIALIINFLGGCAFPSTTLQKQALTPAPAPKPEKENNFQNRLGVSIPIKLPNGSYLHVQADITRPEKKIEPKTLVILVPGSGNVSRRGEIGGNGVDSYAAPIEIYSLWSKALSDEGFFVLSYDKRTCNPSFNLLCKTNATKDIDEMGIRALAQDLDQIYDFAAAKLASMGDQPKIILIATTQGAQVVAQAACAKRASGVVLLSPIAGDLESMWVEGLMRAHNQKANSANKTRLLNEAETTKSFFSSLKQNKFPDNSQVHGASIRFWRSWVESSARTIAALAATQRPVLILLSHNDVFNVQDSILKDKNYLKNKINFSIKTIEKADRNFINEGRLVALASKQVADFVKKLKD